MKKSLVKLIKIPKISDDCFLCFAQNPDQIPFPIKRIYYIFGSKPGLPRGSHAHYQTEQILFCIQGRVKIILDDGKKKSIIILNKPEVGIYLGKKIWHEMHDLRPKTILLVLASHIYKEKDYIRDYEKFLKVIENNETD